MRGKAGPLFVERRKYRRRRLNDAARFLPLAGLVLVLLPMLWARGDGGTIAQEKLYLFAVWAALILGAALLSRALGGGQKGEGAPSPPPVANPPPGPPPDAPGRVKAGRRGNETGAAAP